MKNTKNLINLCNLKGIHKKGSTFHHNLVTLFRILPHDNKYDDDLFVDVCLR